MNKVIKNKKLKTEFRNYIKKYIDFRSTDDKILLLMDEFINIYEKNNYYLESEKNINKVNKVENPRMIILKNEITGKLEKIDPPITVQDIVPSIIPDKEENEIVKNTKYIQTLLNLGRTESIPKYTPAATVALVLCFVLTEKYRLFPFTNIRGTKARNKLSIEKSKIKKFINEIEITLKKGIKVSVCYFSHFHHANMLIINSEKREIIRFEPHGYQFNHGKNEEIINDVLKDLVDDVNRELRLKTKPFKYFSPKDIQPKINDEFIRGFQDLEGRASGELRQEGGGYCQLWSWFFASLVVSNPNIEVKKLYKLAYDLIGTEPKKFKDVIRGFFHYINIEMKKMKNIFRNLDISKSEIKNLSYIDMEKILSAYIELKFESLENKPNIEYGKGRTDNKYKFITKSGQMINLFH
jgi:hypothetical protein